MALEVLLRIDYAAARALYRELTERGEALDPDGDAAPLPAPWNRLRRELGDLHPGESCYLSALELARLYTSWKRVEEEWGYFGSSTDLTYWGAYPAVNRLADMAGLLCDL